MPQQTCRSGVQAESNQAPNRSDLEEPLRRVNEVLSGDGVPFEMSDPQGGRLVTKLVDQESGDLIRQVPAEEVLRMGRSGWRI